MRRSIVLKQNMKKMMTRVLPMLKKVLNEKINQIKSSIMGKIMPNNFKNRRNAPKRIFNTKL